MVTRATVFKEPGATPAQATTHVRPRTADRHHDVLPHLRPRANNPALPGLPPLFHTVYTPFHTKWYEFFACFFLMHAFMTDPEQETWFPAHDNRARATPVIGPMPVHMAWDLES